MKCAHYFCKFATENYKIDELKKKMYVLLKIKNLICIGLKN